MVFGFPKKKDDKFIEKKNYTLEKLHCVKEKFLESYERGRITEEELEEGLTRIVEKEKNIMMKR
jgi:hypothetical protein